MLTITQSSLFLICLTALFSCTQGNSSVLKQQEQKVDNAQVSLAIEKSITQGDFRLYNTQGRRIVVPGFETFSLSKLQQMCGIKPLAGTGDVLKSEEERLKRKAKYQFAKSYNQKIYKLCKENSSK